MRKPKLKKYLVLHFEITCMKNLVDEKLQKKISLKIESLVLYVLGDDNKSRVSSGQGKVREIPDLAKVREFCWRSGKNEYWEKSGNLHLVQSK